MGSDGSSGFNLAADSAKMDDFIDHATDSWATRGDIFQTDQPNGKAIMYLNIGNVSNASSGVYNSFLEQSAARASGYLAHTGSSSGAEIPNPFGGSSVVLDVGKVGVKEAMVADMRGRSSYADWNGVFGDDVNTFSNIWGTTPIFGYSSPTDWWNNAMLPCMSYISDQLALDGKVFIPNLGNYPSDVDAIVRDAWPHSNFGVFCEFCGTYPNGAVMDNKTLENIYAGCRAAIEGGKIFYGITHPPTDGLSNAQYAKYGFCIHAVFGGDLPTRMRMAMQKDYGTTGLVWDAVFDTVIGLPTGPVVHTTNTATWSRVFGNAAGGSKTVSFDLSTRIGTIV